VSGLWSSFIGVSNNPRNRSFPPQSIIDARKKKAAELP
jgi:hypothetical protein